MFDFLDDIPSSPLILNILSPKHTPMSDGSVGHTKSSLRLSGRRWLEEKFPELLSHREAMREFVELWMLRQLRTVNFEELSLILEEAGGSNLARWEREVLQTAQLTSINQIISEEQFVEMINGRLHLQHLLSIKSSLKWTKESNLWLPHL